MSLRPPISGLVCISFVSRCLRNKRDTPYTGYFRSDNFGWPRCRRKGNRKATKGTEDEKSGGRGKRKREKKEEGKRKKREREREKKEIKRSNNTRASKAQKQLRS